MLHRTTLIATLLAGLFLGIPGPAQPQANPPRTAAETSNYTAGSRHADVMDFWPDSTSSVSIIGQWLSRKMRKLIMW